MSTTIQVTKATIGAAAAARPAAALDRPAAPAPLARHVAGRLGGGWVPRAGWALGRTGIAGVVGLGALVAAAVFLLSTHLPASREVAALRAELAASRGRPPAAARDEAADPAASLRALPGRADVPGILRQLFANAVQARLAIQTGTYEVAAPTAGGVVRYHIAFPVAGPYPQIREFLDTTLATTPSLALTELALERSAIGNASVEARIRMTLFTTVAGGAAPARAAPERSERVVPPTHAAALFAPHSWFVPRPAAPPPPPAPEAPPPAPTAPPFPYTLVGSFAPAGEPPVWFLARGDHVVDAHVGDRLDGVYQFESATGGQLVFVYLPLNVRHTVAAGGSK